MREYTQRAIALERAANLFRDVVVLEGVVVCEHAAGAVLLGAILAVGADAAAVHHAPNAHGSTNGKVFDVTPHRHNSADYLVTRHHRELRGTPVFAHLVDVGMADAAEHDFDGDVVAAGGTARDCVRD